MTTQEQVNKESLKLTESINPTESLKLTESINLEDLFSEELGAEHVAEIGVSYLTVNLGTEVYGIPLSTVKEIISVPEITPIPFAPAFCLGAMNLRGHVVTVVDLRLKLGIPAAASRQTAVVICDLAPLTIGIVVDSVTSVINVPPEKVQEASRIQGDSGRDFFTGAYEKNETLYLLIDPARAVGVHSYFG